MPLPREQSAGYLVNHLGRQFAVLLANRLKPLGLARRSTRCYSPCGKKTA